MITEIDAGSDGCYCRFVFPNWTCLLAVDEGIAIFIKVLQMRTNSVVSAAAVCRENAE